MPADAAALTAAGFASNAVTEKPFLTRLPAIGRPMVPTPMNPIRVIDLLRSVGPAASIPGQPIPLMALAARPAARAESPGPVSYTTRAMLAGFLFIGPPALSWGTPRAPVGP